MSLSGIERFADQLRTFARISATAPAPLSVSVTASPPVTLATLPPLQFTISRLPATLTKLIHSPFITSGVLLTSPSRVQALAPLRIR